MSLSVTFYNTGIFNTLLESICSVDMLFEALLILILTYGIKFPKRLKA